MYNFKLETSRFIFDSDFKRQLPGSPEGGGALNKVLYGEPEVQSLTLLYTIFDRKGTPFVYLPLKNGTPFTYLLKNAATLF